MLDSLPLPPEGKGEGEKRWEGEGAACLVGGATLAGPFAGYIFPGFGRDGERLSLVEANRRCATTMPEAGFGLDARAMQRRLSQQFPGLQSRVTPCSSRVSVDSLLLPEAEEGEEECNTTGATGPTAATGDNTFDLDEAGSEDSDCASDAEEENAGPTLHLRRRSSSGAAAPQDAQWLLLGNR